MELPIIKTIPAYTIYTAEKEMKSREEIPNFVAQIISQTLISNPKLKATKPDYCFGCYPLQDLRKKKFIYKYCQAVKKPGKVEFGSVKFDQLVKTKVLSFTFEGPYDNFMEIYKFLFEYFKINKNVKPLPNRLVREVYIKGPWNEQNPKKYITEFQIPIVEQKIEE